MMQQNESFRLVTRRGPQPNQRYEIGADATTLGRGINNDIVINDREISRSHLRILRAGDALTVEDLGSTNGTFVNGKRISGVTPLQAGDIIGLGDTVSLGLESTREENSLRDLLPAEPADAPTPGPQVNYGLQPAPAPVADAPPGPEPYAQPDMPAYADAAPAPGQQPGYPPPQPGYPPPAPPQQGYQGYEYDPYAAREERSGTSPWLILGCFVFFVLVFVCFAGIALVLIDTLDLWCDVPVVSDVVKALALGC